MNLKYTNLIVLILMSFSLLILGLSFTLGANPAAVKEFSTFYNVTGLVPTRTLGFVFGIGLCFMAMSFLLTYMEVMDTKVSFLLVTIVCVFVLLTLVSPSRWLASEGGFPVIGSGQGIIKYFAILPVFTFLFYKDKFKDNCHTALNYLPVAMVLFWIGGVKFMEFEAKAIVKLVETSPFMSWMYEVFSVQMASNVIGFFDITFAFLLGVGIIFRQQRLILLSALACFSVFLMTQTFMFSAEAALSDETLLNRLGQFVIKDLWFIANLVIVLHLTTSNEGKVFMAKRA
ncbi:hypothetical protein CWC05_04505 [Pseudoalteromonas ruthenica]|uniref:DUF417 domain-containing protein n=1 Tax=Pseudoalteromonas ruthenica TaxID=151081 RepID=A0A5S3Z8W4_9GAMM|nr:DUF417 family protein [Pseudoalteromonas ruthenica]TLX50617.1 hypothetical protein CWC31_10505 [Pseudoalteromonas ruthenica]TMP88692.1 hypothetical protein CWC05_04505 [Pseudoalteromonas ruthenica]